MKCFELRDDHLVKGLPVDDAGSSPGVNANASGEWFIPLIPTSAAFFLRQPSILKPLLRVDDVTLTEQGLAPVRKYERKALMKIDVNAGQGGKVQITSGAYEERQHAKDDRVEKIFRQFPSFGIDLVSAPPGDEGIDDWVEGAERVTLMITMSHGACFRVHRTGNLKGLLKDLFVEWDAFQGMKLRPSKKWADIMKKETVPQRRETLLPPVGLA